MIPQHEQSEGAAAREPSNSPALEPWHERCRRFLRVCVPHIQPGSSTEGELLLLIDDVFAAGEDAVLRKASRNLMLYADECALILKQNGYPAKAQSLEARMSAVAHALNCT